MKSLSEHTILGLKNTVDTWRHAGGTDRNDCKQVIR